MTACRSTKLTLCCTASNQYTCKFCMISHFLVFVGQLSLSSHQHLSFFVEKSTEFCRNCMTSQIISGRRYILQRCEINNINYCFADNFKNIIDPFLPVSRRIRGPSSAPSPGRRAPPRRRRAAPGAACSRGPAASSLPPPLTLRTGKR